MRKLRELIEKVLKALKAIIELMMIAITKRNIKGIFGDIDANVLSIFNHRNKVNGTDLLAR